jgi:gas vesicle protein GvpK
MSAGGGRPDRPGAAGGGRPDPLGVDLTEALRRLGGAPDRRVELGTDRESLERGLVQLVLTVVELLRQLMERQALRRVDQGDLSDEQVERLGTTLALLAERMEELKQQFDLSDEDLNLDLGPLGPLLPREP